MQWAEKEIKSHKLKDIISNSEEPKVLLNRWKMICPQCLTWKLLSFTRCKMCEKITEVFLQNRYFNCLKITSADSIYQIIRYTCYHVICLPVLVLAMGLRRSKPRARRYSSSVTVTRMRSCSTAHAWRARFVTRPAWTFSRSWPLYLIDCCHAKPTVTSTCYFIT